jgi:hypothetical protein
MLQVMGAIGHYATLHELQNLPLFHAYNMDVITVNVIQHLVIKSPEKLHWRDYKHFTEFKEIGLKSRRSPIIQVHIFLIASRGLKCGLLLITHIEHVE